MDGRAGGKEERHWMPRTLSEWDGGQWSVGVEIKRFKEDYSVTFDKSDKDGNGGLMVMRMK